MPSDALFQLGMYLDHRSSTAQTEETQSLCLNPEGSEERNDFFCERNGERYAGTHLIIDLVGAARLDDLDHIETTLRRCVDAARATLLHIHLHRFETNGGVSGVAVLAESHISIHTWPEHGYAAADVFTCGRRANAEVACLHLVEALEAGRHEFLKLTRGTGGPAQLAAGSLEDLTDKEPTDAISTEDASRRLAV